MIKDFKEKVDYARKKLKELEDAISDVLEDDILDLLDDNEEEFENIQRVLEIEGKYWTKVEELDNLMSVIEKIIKTY